MFRMLVIGAHSTIAVMFSGTAFAQGTAAEAKAMLEKAVVAMKADKVKTLDTINKAEGGFLNRDLYCSASTSATVGALPVAALVRLQRKRLAST
jgi:hypothetical protein